MDVFALTSKSGIGVVVVVVVVGSGGAVRSTHHCLRRSKNLSVGRTLTIISAMRVGISPGWLANRPSVSGK